MAAGVFCLAGLFPVLTVETILSIARQAESVFDHDVHFDHLMQARSQRTAMRRLCSKLVCANPNLGL